MRNTYIVPQFIAITIDKEISLRLATFDPDADHNKVLEPGSGGAGLGGVGNGSGEGSPWERTGLGNPKDPFGSGIWEK